MSAQYTDKWEPCGPPSGPGHRTWAAAGADREQVGSGAAAAVTLGLTVCGHAIRNRTFLFFFPNWESYTHTVKKKKKVQN